MVEEPIVESEVGTDLTEACLEVGATQSGPPIEGTVVAVTGFGRRIGQGRRRERELGVGRGDPGHPGEPLGADLLGRSVGLLPEQPDRQVGGLTLDRAGGGLTFAGEEREQRALPRAVGADDPEPGRRGDRQVEAVEQHPIWRLGPQPTSDDRPGHARSLPRTPGRRRRRFARRSEVPD